MRSYAEKCGMPYVNERWLGGMLTNFETMSKRVGKMLEYERMKASGEFDAMIKKEALMLDRELEKLQRNLGGLRGMKQRPDAIFVLDTKKEHIAVTEANKLGIPVVAVVDTNVDPEVVQFPIPGNDDAIRANSLLARVIADAVEEGRYIAAKRNPIPAPPQRSAEEDAAFEKAQADARNAAAQAQAERDARLRGAQARRRPTTTPTTSRRAAAAEPAEADDGCPRKPPPRRPMLSRRQPRRSSRPKAAVESRRPRPTSTVADDGADDEPADTESPAATPTTRSPTTRPTHLTRPRPKPKVEHPDDVHRQDVKALRDSTGAGMMDCKKALEETDGDIDAAKQFLREKGLAASAKRDDRDNNQGVVALKVDGNVGAIVELKCETDFVAGSEQFKAEADGAGRPRRRQGHRCGRRAGGRARGAEDHAQGEDRARRGRAHRGRRRQRARQLRAHPGWPRRQRRARRGGRRHAELAHDIAVHIAFARPKYLAATTCRPTWSKPSARRSRRSPATRASPRRRCPRSSRVA